MYMPYEIIKKPSGKYEVINKLTGEIHAKGTTLKKAKAQVRLLKGKGRKGRRAYPEEEYSSSESDSDMEGGVQGHPAPANPQTHLNAIANLLNRDVNTQAEARAVDAEIRRHQEQLRGLLTARDYRTRRDALNADPRYQRIGTMCHYTFDEIDDLEGGGRLPNAVKPRYSDLVQPVNPKFLPFSGAGRLPDAVKPQYTDIVQPVNPKFLPFF
jgi:hypothetical protein